jgi:hypothetical protein
MNCQCNCRHISRWLCRVYEEKGFNGTTALSIAELTNKYEVEDIYDDYDFGDILSKYLSVAAARDLSISLNLCKCCSKHQEARYPFHTDRSTC